MDSLMTLIPKKQQQKNVVDIDQSQTQRRLHWKLHQEILSKSFELRGAFAFLTLFSSWQKTCAFSHFFSIFLERNKYGVSHSPTNKKHNPAPFCLCAFVFKKPRLARAAGGAGLRGDHVGATATARRARVGRARHHHSRQRF